MGLAAIQSQNNVQKCLDGSKIQAWRSGAAGTRREKSSPFHPDRSRSPLRCRGQPSLSLADFDPPFSDALFWLAAGRQERGAAGRVLEQRRHVLQTIPPPSPQSFTESHRGTDPMSDCKHPPPPPLPPPALLPYQQRDAQRQ